MRDYGFGIDLGGTTCKLGLFEVSGKLLEKWEIPTNKADNGSHILEDIAQALKDKMNQIDDHSKWPKGMTEEQRLDTKQAIDDLCVFAADSFAAFCLTCFDNVVKSGSFQFAKA